MLLYKNLYIYIYIYIFLFPPTLSWFRSVFVRQLSWCPTDWFFSLHSSPWCSTWIQSWLSSCFKNHLSLDITLFLLPAPVKAEKITLSKSIQGKTPHVSVTMKMNTPSSKENNPRGIEAFLFIISEIYATALCPCTNSTSATNHSNTYLTATWQIWDLRLLRVPHSSAVLHNLPLTEGDLGVER